MGSGSAHESPPGDPRLGLQPGQRRVGRIPPEPPRVPSPDQLLAEAPAVGETDLGDESSVAVALFALDGHDLAEGQPREVLLRAGRIRLASLRGVDPAEPDDLRSARPKDGERVPVSDADDPPGERLGRRLADQQEKCGSERERVPHSRAPGQGVQDGRSALPARCPRRLGRLPVQQPKGGGPLAAVDHVDPDREDLAVDGRTNLCEPARLVAEPLDRAAGLRHGLPSRRGDRPPPWRGSRGRPAHLDERARLVDRGLPQPSALTPARPARAVACWRFRSSSGSCQVSRASSCPRWTRSPSRTELAGRVRQMGDEELGHVVELRSWRGRGGVDGGPARPPAGSSGPAPGPRGRTPRGARAPRGRAAARSGARAPGGRASAPRRPRGRA